MRDWLPARRTNAAFGRAQFAGEVVRRGLGRDEDVSGFLAFRFGFRNMREQGLLFLALDLRGAAGQALEHVLRPALDALFEVRAGAGRCARRGPARRRGRSAICCMRRARLPSRFAADFGISRLLVRQGLALFAKLGFLQRGGTFSAAFRQVSGQRGEKPSPGASASLLLVTRFRFLRRVLDGGGEAERLRRG